MRSTKEKTIAHLARIEMQANETARHDLQTWSIKTAGRFAKTPQILIVAQYRVYSKVLDVEEGKSHAYWLLPNMDAAKYAKTNCNEDDWAST